MDEDLSRQLNEGLVPPPDLAGEPGRLQRPDWQPTAVQLEQAKSSAVRIMVAAAALLVLARVLFVYLSGLSN